MDIKKIWDSALNSLELEVSSVAFDVWIKNLKPVTIDNNCIILSTETAGSLNTIKNTYIDKIKTSVIQVCPSINEVVIVLEKDALKYMKDMQNKKEEQVTSLNDITIHFDKKYTFDSFVVGSSNKFVHAAALSVAENPGNSYNPLFIYGGVGLGKTHLMHAIGNYLQTTKPNLTVTYVTSEGFMNELIESIRSGHDKSLNKKFREKYRNIDVLMIDDIQFISNKVSTQEEFFHTFNDLYNNNKQIIISSDRPPKELTTLEERLRSRFQGGLIADIQPPDIETRIAILRKKASIQNYNIENNVIDFIAENFDTNIREMEGLLKKVNFYALLNNESIVTMSLAKEALKDCNFSQKEAISADNIINAVSEYFNLTKDQLIGKKRNKELVEARHICIYLIYDFLSLPLSSIGEIMGKRDHTSIMHARDNIQEKIEKDMRIKTFVSDIKNIILKK